MSAAVRLQRLRITAGERPILHDVDARR